MVEYKEKEISFTKRCPTCGSKYLIEDSTTKEIYCQNCGHVLREVGVDQGPEWREFLEEKSRSRVGPPQSILYEHLGLSTLIPPYLKDVSGKTLPTETQKQLRKLRKVDKMLQLYRKRSLVEAVKFLKIYSEKLNLPDYITEEAMQIYEKAFEKGFIKGRAIKSLISASLYVACRLNNIVRDLKEFEKACKIPKKDIARDYRLLTQQFNIKLPTQDPIIFVEKIASKLDLNQEVRQKIIQETIDILSKAREIRITSGKPPITMATTALYLVCKKNNLEITEKDVVEASGITFVTLRNRIKDFKKLIPLPEKLNLNKS